ncbi:MAG TPA: YbgF trimerization domain-containing protein [Burkholderiales bacterium]|nr:YbgF trimerization domain-containing protein [Burkholderiales bacterium]
MAILAGIVLTVAGCATQDELRQTEAQQGEAVQTLRAEANRNASVISDLRGQIKRTQESVHALEADLTEARVRADAAKAQADSALMTSREFLANLLAARDEQRRQLDESGITFADLRRKAADLESRLQAQQRLIDQGNVAFKDAIRRLIAVEAGLQEAGRRSGTLEAKANTGRESDVALSQQLAALRGQVEETRSVISSEGLLQLMREMEDMRRSSASLRGLIDELQQAQANSTEQARHYYLDLDSRVRKLKQPAPQTSREADPKPAAASEPAAASQ